MAHVFATPGLLDGVARDALARMANKTNQQVALVRTITARVGRSGHLDGICIVPKCLWIVVVVAVVAVAVV